MTDFRSLYAGDAGSEDGAAVDAVAIELATGLSITDIEALGDNPSPDVRAEIAVKFAREYDRLARNTCSRLTNDLLDIFSKDRETLVRSRFAECIKASAFLPAPVVERFAHDVIDVAAPILQSSPALADAVIGEIIVVKPEPYALAITARRPLAQSLTDLLIKHKGTIRIVTRLLENDEAALSEATLLSLQDWGRLNPGIADRLAKRPNLPFGFVNQNVTELADEVRWPSLGERTMTRFEATQLQSRFEGKSWVRCFSNGERFRRLQLPLREKFERGLLKPSTLLAFLRDGDIDQLECGFAVVTDLDLHWVRKLLHNGDRRGLIALCLKAEFSAADYLAFRMALSLAEMGTVREEPAQRYKEKTMEFARDQFERMRREPHLLKRWLPSDAV